MAPRWLKRPCARSPCRLRFASPELQADPALALVAVAGNPRALTHASAELRAGKFAEYVQAAGAGGGGGGGGDQLLMLNRAKMGLGL